MENAAKERPRTSVLYRKRKIKMRKSGQARQRIRTKGNLKDRVCSQAELEW
jgi:hypothetical protein